MASARPHVRGVLLADLPGAVGRQERAQLGAQRRVPLGRRGLPFVPFDGCGQGVRSQHAHGLDACVGRPGDAAGVSPGHRRLPVKLYEVTEARNRVATGSRSVRTGAGLTLVALPVGSSSGALSEQPTRVRTSAIASSPARRSAIGTPIRPILPTGTESVVPGVGGKLSTGTTTFSGAAHRGPGRPRRRHPGRMSTRRRRPSVAPACRGTRRIAQCLVGRSSGIGGTRPRTRIVRRGGRLGPPVAE